METINSNISVLIADDEKEIRESVSGILTEEGYHVHEFDPCAPDPAVLQKKYDVAILDMVMPGIDGFTLRKEIIQHSPETQFILITGYPDREKLEKAMDLGVYSFLPKPFTASHVIYAVMGALRMKQLLHKSVRQDVLLNTGTLGLIGESHAMAEARRRIIELAPLDIPVLITGESGTGKEIVARCIHQCSPRTSKPFNAINCAGFSSSLIESELFGHAHGSFTGAVSTKYGFFEVSDRGTLFLDEIGDLPLELQSKFLRVLDTGRIYRVGETVFRQVDVRIISATNRNLENMTNEDLFRNDLYYRLRGAQIHISPLRERKEDIPSLVHYFLKDSNIAIAPDAIELLQQFDWPGNVRELRMAIENCKGISPGRIITEDAVASVIGIKDKNMSRACFIPSYNEFKRTIIKNSEKKYFETLLKYSCGNISRAAERAGMYRKNLYEKLKQFGLEN